MRSIPREGKPAVQAKCPTVLDLWLDVCWREIPDGDGDAYPLPLPIDKGVRDDFKRVEIAERYKRKKKAVFNPSAIQLNEIMRLCRHRYGSDTFPDTEIGRAMLDVAGFIIAGLNDAKPKLLALFKRAPWLTRDEVADLTRRWAKGRWYRAVTLGQKFAVTAAERELLKLTQMRSIDGPHPATERRRKRREREEGRRRSQGAKPRAQYLEAALTRTRPWEDLGVSRATWYRRLKEGIPLDAPVRRVRRVRQVHGHHTSSLAGHGPVSNRVSEGPETREAQIAELNRQRALKGAPPLGAVALRALGLGD